MKDIRMILPPLASDTAGACSMLFESGGLTVIHDAAGSTEVFITFEEQRDLDKCRTVGSQLSQVEAVTGNDQILLDRITTELERRPAPFAAIVGTPVPFTICIDLEGIAAEAEERSGTPVFSVGAGGFQLYHRGAGEALKKLLERMTPPDAVQKKGRVNLLGAFPMDLSSAELEGVRSCLLEAGAEEVCSLTMNGGLDEITSPALCNANIVLSLSGLPAAKWMKQKFGVPYAVGLPFDRESAARLLAREERPAPQPETGKQVLVLGESVFAASLADLCRRRGFRATAGLAEGLLPGWKPEGPFVVPETETQLKQLLAGDWDVIVGDPLYRLLLPRDSKAVFLNRPHQALSARLYPPAAEPLENLLQKMEEEL